MQRFNLDDYLEDILDRIPTDLDFITPEPVHDDKTWRDVGHGQHDDERAWPLDRVVTEPSRSRRKR